MLATKILTEKKIVIPITVFLIDLAKTFANRECGRACARSSVIVVLGSGASAFWQNCTIV